MATGLARGHPFGHVRGRGRPAGTAATALGVLTMTIRVFDASRDSAGVLGLWERALPAYPIQPNTFLQRTAGNQNYRQGDALLAVAGPSASRWPRSSARPGPRPQARRTWRCCWWPLRRAGRESAVPS